MNKYLPQLLVVMVLVTGVVGLIITFSEDLTSNVVEEPACSSVHPTYSNCATPNGGCPGRFPDWKQYSFSIQNRLTCCCVPYRSDHMNYRNE